ncbi:hypothetical protein P171DRAFT_514238 [Karstenula rhodostoma CBS 690.94]|uniref:Uncharacterized protein n=1 Tax=Karstenula rhodostoma CBS 690.94 TaxID=1392251 RepID=A0A9P4UCE9_9PLEO|nr:hypothetical protein P171DRAFT_514238 [Karstenula rhodostoma CBS 690.94]
MESHDGFRLRKYIPTSGPTIVISSPTPAPSPAPTPTPSARKVYIMAKSLPSGAKKAKGMEVNISGFYGIHPIETGIAYWYRGHYMYSTVGVPVEPIPFATKKGIHIVGTTVDTAPPFRPGGVPGVRYEPEVAALHRSMVHTWEDQEKEKKEDAGTGAFGARTDGIQGLKQSDYGVNPTQSDESVEWSQGRFHLEVTKNEAKGHYNDRAMFLAQSAPGSHRGTPTQSRANTPKPWASHALSPAPFGTVASTSRMQTLLEQGPVIEGLLALQEKHPELLNPHAVNSYLSSLNNVRNQQPSRPVSRVTSSISLAELNNILPQSQSRPISRVTSGNSLAELNNTLPRPPSRPLSRVSSGLFLAGSKPKVVSNVSSRSASIHKDLPGPSMLDLVQARQKTASRIGRARSDSMKAASLALNAAFNDHNKESNEEETKKTGGSVLKCSVHGDDCDGVTVTNEHLTLQNIKARGLKEEYPMVVNEGRTMIDWFALMKEERDVGK